MKTTETGQLAVKPLFQSRVVPSALMLACLAFAGCGGGGSTPTPTISSLSGKVIDGYIEGAEVCLDLNNNQVCDTSEPKDTTKADGSYKLDTTGLTAAQIKAAHLLTNVPKTAKDADDGGKTLEAAGKSAFSLLAPAAAYVNADASAITGAVISPFTTLVSHDMIANSTPLVTAQNDARTRLKLAEGTDLTQDFVAKKDAALAEKAQMLAAAIGQVKAKALADTTTAPTNKQALFAALQYLRTQVADLQTAFDAAKVSNSSAKPADLVKTVIESGGGAAAPVVADLVAEAKKTTDSTAVSASSLTALIEQGFYGAQHVLDCANMTACTSDYWKVQGSGGKIVLDNDYEYDPISNSWKKSSTSGQHDWVMTSAGWKLENACATGQSASYSVGSDGVTTVTQCSGLAERVTTRMVDASGKTLAALNLNPPTGFESLVMPSGSQLYWFDFVATEDRYYLYTGVPPAQFVNINGTSEQRPYSSLDEFISVNGTPTDGVSSRFTGWSGLQFSFDAGGTASGGSLTLWAFVNGMPSKTGKSTYELRTVNGQKMLILKAQAPYNDPGKLLMFSVKDGTVYSGQFTPTTIRSGQGHFNKTMMNAILAAGKLPAVVD